MQLGAAEARLRAREAAVSKTVLDAEVSALWGRLQR